MPFQHTTKKIKELDKAIQVNELSQIDKLENIQLSKDLKVESEITHQIDHKIEILDDNNIVAKTDTYNLAKDEDQKKTQNQYLTFNSSVLEVFLATSTNMQIDNLEYQPVYNTIADLDKANPYKSEGREPARLNQLDKQQK